MIRRVPNPRYRPPVALPSGIEAFTRGRPRALDHLHVQLARRGAGTAHPITDWDASVGEEGASGRRYLVSATGGGSAGRDDLRMLRFEARLRPLEVALGDAPPLALMPGQSPLHGLRGATLRTLASGQPVWKVALGGPTPSGSAPAPRLRVAGAGVADLRFDIARFAAGVFGFATQPAAPDPTRLQPILADTSRGGGAETGLAWSLPATGGSLAGQLAGQYHSLDGHGRIAVRHALAWTLATPRLVAEVRDQRSSPGIRRLAGDRLLPDAQSDTRWSVQSRHRGGRVEWHCVGAARAGGDTLLEHRTLQLGGSSGLGRSPWQLGGEATWERHAGARQGRLTFSAGRLGAGRVSFVGRVERVSGGDGPARHLLTGDVLLPIGQGARITLQPRFGWSGAALDHGGAMVQLRRPLGATGGSLTATLAAGAERLQGFRGRLREAGLALVWAPRPRDRGVLEARRLDERGQAQMEYTAAYDLEVQRFALASGRAVIDSGVVLVRVVRSGNGEGIADALVALDEAELRFTDADGVARFDRVAPGVHRVAVDEASLPTHHQVAGSARVFVVVERGVPTPTPVFEVSRPEKRSSF